MLNNIMEDNDSATQSNQTPPNPSTPQQPTNATPSQSSFSPSVSPTPPAPTVDPAQPVVAQPVANPGVIVLQWLTYAFWGWTILGVSVLTSMVLANFIGDYETGSFMPYGIAAVLVLLPISIVCDMFYSKKEPQKKSGASSIVMVIHAVLFALFGIGSLICMVISLILMLTSSGDATGKQIALYSALIIFILYSAVFIRTINPERFPIIKRLFPIFMTAVVGVIAVLGFVGPFAKERVTRDDRLIENNLSSLKSDIDGYVQTNKKLPDSLNAVNTYGDAKVLVDKNIIKYTPNTKAGMTVLDKYSTNLSTSQTFYYQLCATFTNAKNNRYNSTSYNNQDTDGYSTYLDIYYHGKGEECYKLKVENYSY